MRKHFLQILVLGSVLALLLRLGVSWELAGHNGGRNPIFTPHRATDMFTYRTLSAQIAEGTHSEEYYYQPFYYAVFLPAIRLTVGDSIWAVIVIQAILGALTVYLTALTAALVWNRTAAILALIFTSCSEMLILYTPFHLNETLQTFWIVLLFYLCVQGIKSRKFIHWMFAAIVAGCAILTRGNTWFLIPGMIAAAIVTMRNSWGGAKTYLAVAVLLMCLLLLQLPFIWRNSSIKGDLTGASTGAGPNLAMGNTPEAPPGGRNPDLKAGPTEYPPTYLSWTEARDGTPVATKIREWIFSEPFAFLELSFRKLLLFWDHREIPDNISRLGEGSWSLLLKIAGFCRTGLIIAPALAATLLLLRRSFKKRNLKMLLLYYFVLSYWLATSMFFVLARFRVPIIPLLAILAAIFIDHILQLKRRRSSKVFLPAVLALGVGIFISFSAYPLYQENLEASVMRVVRPHGVRVALTQTTIMHLDNGPFTFGDWTTLRVDENTTIVKQFAGLNIKRGQIATLELSLFFTQPGRAILLINGQKHAIHANSGGSMSPRFPIRTLQNDTVTIKLLSATSEVYCIVDRQREYGRTWIDGQKVSGELVARLYLHRGR